MAVIKVPQDSAIAIKLQKGLTTSGSPSYVTRNYPGKASAADQDLFDVAQGLMGVQAHPVASIERVDNAYLVNQ